LFNLYMADLAYLLQTLVGDGVRFHIYADDVLIYIECTPNGLDQALQTLQHAVTKTDDWMRHHNLLLNLGKSHFFLLHGVRRSLPSTPLTIKLGGKDFGLVVSDDFRWLGVDVDVHLTLETFVKHTCRCCFGVLRMIGRIRPCLDRHSTMLLCNALVRSRVEYCAVLLASAKNSTLSMLQRVLNLAARVISRCRRTDHISPVLRDLGWLKMQHVVTEKLAILVFKVLHQRAPAYLESTVRVYIPRRSLRSSEAQAIILELGAASSRTGREAWSVAAPAVWNSLPAELRVCGKSLREFCRLVKMHLGTMDQI